MSDKILYRELTLDRKGMVESERTIPASLSSELEVPRWFGREVLEHKPESVNLDRAKDGLPLLFGHDHMQPIGLAENLRVEDSRLKGDLKFSENDRAKDVWRDVTQGFLRNVSIGYRINEYEDDADTNVRKVTDWEVFEVSVVSVPADASVGINRADNTEEIEMAETETRKGEEAGQGSGVNHDDINDRFKNARMRAIEDGKREGMLLEQERRDGITNAFSPFFDREGARDLMEVCVNQGMTVDQARDSLLRYLGDGVTPTFRPVSDEVRRDKVQFTGNGRFNGGVTIGEDALDKFSRAAEISLAVQSNGVYTKEDREEVRKDELGSMSAVELAREYCRITGRKANGNRSDVIGLALQRDVSHGTSHFAGVLENVANKSMLDGFEQAEESWNMWAQTRNVPDFKPNSLLNMSLFSDLSLVRESAEYTYGDMSDLKEVIQLATYGRLFSISRQALANDDLSALSDIPRNMGAAAAYKVGDIVYAILTTGTTATMLQDSTALFDAATHANYVTSGAAPSIATLDAGRLAMALQTDPQSKVLGIRPAYLIVPEALKTSSDTLIAATYDPAGTAGTLTPNPFTGRLKVVSDHRLDTHNSAGWYLAAARNTVTVGFLNGQETPYLETKDGWDVDGVEYKVRIDAAAAASDYRGLFYNDGVT